ATYFCARGAYGNYVRYA
nr:immunoglobulin heavy chain junction region [Mus musculus]